MRALVVLLIACVCAACSPPVEPQYLRVEHSKSPHPRVDMLTAYPPVKAIMDSTLKATWIDSTRITEMRPGLSSISVFSGWFADTMSYQARTINGWDWGYPAARNSGCPLFPIIALVQPQISNKTGLKIFADSLSMIRLAVCDTFSQWEMAWPSYLVRDEVAKRRLSWLPGMPEGGYFRSVTGETFTSDITSVLDFFEERRIQAYEKGMFR